jgi:hypothetical protein
MSPDKPSDRYEEPIPGQPPEEVAVEGIDIGIEAMWRVYGEINEWSRAADFKASVVLAANGVLIVAAAALASSAGSFSALLRNFLVGICFFIVLVTVVISCAYAARCLIPPLKEGDITSLLFYGYIAAHFPSAHAYEKAVRQSLIDADDNLSQISHQVWSTSRIAKKKIEYTVWSVRFFIAALFFSLVTLIVAYL